MVSFDAEILRVDPAVIALGDEAGTDQAGIRNNPDGPACQAALSAFQSALVFRNIFTALVAVLAALFVVALAYCLYRILDKAWDPTATFTAISGAVTGSASLFLQRERTKAIKVLRESLTDVGTYCGTPVRDQLT